MRRAALGAALILAIVVVIIDAVHGTAIAPGKSPITRSLKVSLADALIAPHQLSTTTRHSLFIVPKQQSAFVVITTPTSTHRSAHTSWVSGWSAAVRHSRRKSISIHSVVETSASLWAKGYGASCIRQHESGNNYSEDTGNGYWGAYQFVLSTWQSLGFAGLPSDAPPAVQDEAAYKLYMEQGWAPWPAISAECGL